MWELAGSLLPFEQPWAGWKHVGAGSQMLPHAASQMMRVLSQVIPELDAPAHVGAGWEAVDPELTTCVYKEPWTDW